VANLVIGKLIKEQTIMELPAAEGEPAHLDKAQRFLVLHSAVEA
jgi:hypothetical protein